MSYIKINEVLKRRGKEGTTLFSGALNGPRIKVLVGSCKHCLKLRDNVYSAAAVLGIDESEIEVVDDLQKLIRYGVMTTPSLIVDGKLVSTGKVLTSEQIQKLLTK